MVEVVRLAGELGFGGREEVQWRKAEAFRLLRDFVQEEKVRRELCRLRAAHWPFRADYARCLTELSRYDEAVAELKEGAMWLKRRRTQPSMLVAPSPFEARQFAQPWRIFLHLAIIANRQGRVADALTHIASAEEERDSLAPWPAVARLLKLERYRALLEMCPTSAGTGEHLDELINCALNDEERAFKEPQAAAKGSPGIFLIPDWRDDSRLRLTRSVIAEAYIIRASLIIRLLREQLPPPPPGAKEQPSKLPSWGRLNRQLPRDRMPSAFDDLERACKLAVGLEECAHIPHEANRQRQFAASGILPPKLQLENKPAPPSPNDRKDDSKEERKDDRKDDRKDERKDDRKGDRKDERKGDRKESGTSFAASASTVVVAASSGRGCDASPTVAAGSQSPASATTSPPRDGSNSLRSFRRAFSPPPANGRATLNMSPTAVGSYSTANESGVATPVPMAVDLLSAIPATPGPAKSTAISSASPSSSGLVDRKTDGVHCGATSAAASTSLAQATTTTTTSTLAASPSSPSTSPTGPLSSRATLPAAPSALSAGLPAASGRLQTASSPPSPSSPVNSIGCTASPTLPHSAMPGLGCSAPSTPATTSALMGSRCSDGASLLAVAEARATLLSHITPCLPPLPARPASQQPTLSSQNASPSPSSLKVPVKDRPADEKTASVAVHLASPLSCAVKSEIDCSDCPMGIVYGRGSSRSRDPARHPPARIDLTRYSPLPIDASSSSPHTVATRIKQEIESSVPPRPAIETDASSSSSRMSSFRSAYTADRGRLNADDTHRRRHSRSPKSTKPNATRASRSRSPKSNPTRPKSNATRASRSRSPNWASIAKRASRPASRSRSRNRASKESRASRSPSASDTSTAAVRPDGSDRHRSRERSCSGGGRIPSPLMPITLSGNRASAFSSRPSIGPSAKVPGAANQDTAGSTAPVASSRAGPAERGASGVNVSGSVRIVSGLNDTTAAKDAVLVPMNSVVAPAAAPREASPPVAVVPAASNALSAANTARLFGTSYGGSPFIRTTVNPSMATTLSEGGGVGALSPWFVPPVAGGSLVPLGLPMMTAGGMPQMGAGCSFMYVPSGGPGGAPYWIPVHFGPPPVVAAPPAAVSPAALPCPLPISSPTSVASPTASIALRTPAGPYTSLLFGGERTVVPPIACVPSSVRPTPTSGTAALDCRRVMQDSGAAVGAASSLTVCSAADGGSCLFVVPRTKTTVSICSVGEMEASFAEEDGSVDGQKLSMQSTFGKFTIENWSCDDVAIKLRECLRSVPEKTLSGYCALVHREKFDGPKAVDALMATTAVAAAKLASIIPSKLHCLLFREHLRKHCNIKPKPTAGRVAAEKP